MQFHRPSIIPSLKLVSDVKVAAVLVIFGILPLAQSTSASSRSTDTVDTCCRAILRIARFHIGINSTPKTLTFIIKLFFMPLRWSIFS